MAPPQARESRWRTVGHEGALAGLRRAFQGGRLAHAYLLVGPRGVGRMVLAMDLARLVNCVGDPPPCGQCPQCRRIERGLHADVRVLDLAAPREGDGGPRTLLGIDQVRELQREASLKPFEGRYRVFVIDQAERLSEAAANALLKTLEEPPDQVLLVLLAPDTDSLLATIVSRCAVVSLRPLPVERVARHLTDALGMEPRRAQEVARISAGRLGWAITAARDPAILEERRRTLERVHDLLAAPLEERLAYARRLASIFGRDRQTAREELELWLEWWRDVLVCRERGAEHVANRSLGPAVERTASALTTGEVAAALRTVLETIEYLERNVNPLLALEDMLLRLPALPSPEVAPRGPGQL